MIERVGSTLRFAARFTVAGLPGTAVAAVADIFRDGVEIAPNVACTHVGGGLWTCSHIAAVPGTYIAVFHTDDVSAVIHYINAVYQVDPTWLLAILAKVNLIAAVQASTIPNTFAPLGETQVAETAVRWQRDFIVSGFDATGWTEFTFTIKADPETETDDQSAIVLRVSNPDDGATDGVSTLNGREIPAADAARLTGSILVTDVAPDLTFTVTLTADAMAFPAKLESEPYVYEFNIFRDGDKEQIGKGEFIVNQSVRRSTGAP